jgi:hypothetical protein
MLPCLSKRLLGVECPGCGLQRSVVSLLHGDLQESLALYPSLLPMLFFATICLLSLRKNTKIGPRFLWGTAMLVMAIAIGHYILKITGNAPWFCEAEMNFGR